MTNEIKNSGTLSGGSISGGSNLNANVSASGTLEKGKVNTFTKELDPTVPEYIKNLEEEKINDWNSTVDNLDIICPKNTVKGESLLIDDALDYKIFETKIEGNSYQETTTGSNLLNFNVKQTNETKVSIIPNSDGTITINGQGGFTLNFEPLNLESGKTYYQKFEVVSGTIIANNTNDSVFLSFIIDKWIPRGNFISYTPEEDIQKTGIWVHANAVFENVVIKIWANTDKSDFEPYTSAVPSPNPDYPQKIEVIEGNLELKNRNANLYDYKDTNTVTAGAYSTDDEGWITGTYDNTTGTTTKYLNYFTNNLDLKPTTSYKIVLEVKNYSGNAGLYVVSSYNRESQFIDNSLISAKTLSTKKNIILTNKTLSDFRDSTKGLRTFVSVGAGQRVSITFRISVLEDLTITEDTFVYKPYKLNKYNINLQDNFIGKIDDIKDELVIDKKGNVNLVKKIGKVILNGSEPWVKSGNSNENFFSGVLTVGTGLYNYIKTTYPKVLCSYFSPGNLKDNESYYIYNDFGEEGIFEAFAFSLDINKVSTIEQFKEWLYNNNVTVYYVLTEPYEINLGKIDQNFITSNGVNYLFLTSNLSTNIETTYALDIKKYTDKKITELTNVVISTGANL